MPARLVLIDEPSTAMPDTSTRPRVNANAVAAVRRGLRPALVRASWPIVPNGRPTTRPSGTMIQRANTGDSISAAAHIATRPRPSNDAAETADPAAIPPAVSAAAATPTTTPAIVRRRRLAAVGAANSAIAAT